MDQKQFDQFAAGFSNEMKKLLMTKGADYATTSDRLINFYRIAARLRLRPQQVWSVLFIKHIDAILTWVERGELADESIRSRFLDAANYALLGAALADDLSPKDTEEEDDEDECVSVR